MKDSLRRHAHEEEKRTKKLRRLAERLRVSVIDAQGALCASEKAVYESLKNHPALQAQMRRN